MGRLMSNPFPGMNLWLEPHWHSVHARFLTYASDEIGLQLPDDLAALTEEEINIETLRDDIFTRFRPDINIRQTSFEPKTWTGPVAGAGIDQEEGVVVMLDEPVHRCIQIVDGAGALITAIELLSPTNKRDSRARDAYRRKQVTYQEGGINLVEIDLISRGDPIFRADPLHFGQWCDTPYGVCVWRAREPDKALARPIHWRHKLPRIAIPLRPTDPDVYLDLQVALNLSYERGRYANLIDYSFPPFALPDEIMEWTDAVLKEKGLRAVT